MIRFALYRPFRFAVAAALLLAMATPLVTYACDLTGLVEMSVPSAHSSARTGVPVSESDCPCEGPMQDLCGSNAADCLAVVDCYGDSFAIDACCSSQPELNEAVVSASMESIHVQPVVFAFLPDVRVHESDRPQVEAPGHERAPPYRTKAPVHILHSSLLL